MFFVFAGCFRRTGAPVFYLATSQFIALVPKDLFLRAKTDDRDATDQLRKKIIRIELAFARTSKAEASKYAIFCRPNSEIKFLYENKGTTVYQAVRVVSAPMSRLLVH